MSWIFIVSFYHKMVKCEYLKNVVFLDWFIQCCTQTTSNTDKGVHLELLKDKLSKQLPVKYIIYLFPYVCP